MRRASLTRTTTAVLAVAALSLTGCGSDDDTDAAVGTPTVAVTTPASASASASANGSSAAPSASQSAGTGSGAATGVPSGDSSSSAPAPSTSSSPAPSQAADGGTAVKEIEVTIKKGKISPKPGRVKVAKGSKVRIIVTSDKADEAHVHGYDKAIELTPGKPGMVEFTANETGLFEVETHGSHALLFQLVVR